METAKLWEIEQDIKQNEARIYTEKDYYALPQGVRAELIRGKFYNMAAPSYAHQKLLGELYITIGNYIKSKQGPCKVLPAPFAVKLFGDDKTVVEPDISVICDPSKLTKHGCTGAPDWIIEIVSPSNPNSDYVRKFNLYNAAGVREYWIIDPQNESVMVFYFEKHSKEEIVSDSYTDEQHYTFEDKVKVNIYDDLEIDFSVLDIG